MPLEELFEVEFLKDWEVSHGEAGDGAIIRAGIHVMQRIPSPYPERSDLPWLVVVGTNVGQTFRSFAESDLVVLHGDWAPNVPSQVDNAEAFDRISKLIGRGPTKRISFTWNRGVMWDAASKKTLVEIPYGDDESEAVLLHLQAETKNERNPLGERWSLAEWAYEIST